MALLSPHLPSPLVGPTTVAGNPPISLSCYQQYSQASLSLVPLLIVETSPESLTTSPNNQFSINCTARAEVDGRPLNMTIKWIHIVISPPSGPSELMSTLYTTTGSPERGYQNVLTTSENDTVNTIIYRCIATTPSHSSYSDTTVFIGKDDTLKIDSLLLFLQKYVLLLALNSWCLLRSLKAFLLLMSPLLS